MESICTLAVLHSDLISRFKSTEWIDCVWSKPNNHSNEPIISHVNHSHVVSCFLTDLVSRQLMKPGSRVYWSFLLYIYSPQYEWHLGPWRFWGGIVDKNFQRGMSASHGNSRVTLSPVTVQSTSERRARQAWIYVTVARDSNRLSSNRWSGKM